MAQNKHGVLTTKARILRKLYQNEAVGNEDESYSSKIATDLGKTYSHIVKLNNDLEERGLVEKEHRGRKKILTLTDHGQYIAEGLTGILEYGEQNGIDLYIET